MDDAKLLNKYAQLSKKKCIQKSNEIYKSKYDLHYKMFFFFSVMFNHFNQCTKTVDEHYVI